MATTLSIQLRPSCQPRPPSTHGDLSLSCLPGGCAQSPEGGKLASSGKVHSVELSITSRQTAACVHDGNQAARTKWSTSRLRDRNSHQSFVLPRCGLAQDLSGCRRMVSAGESTRGGGLPLLVQIVSQGQSASFKK